MSDPERQGNQGPDATTRLTDDESEVVRRHLFLDLADTLISPASTNWEDCKLINVEKIKIAMEKFQPHFLHIFSFAICGQAELRMFNATIRPLIEKELGMEISLVPTVDDDILPVCCKEMHLTPENVTFSNMSDFWGKAGAFRLCMRKMFANTAQQGIVGEVMLLDDSVYDEIFMWTDLQVKGCILNINKL